MSGLVITQEAQDTRLSILMPIVYPGHLHCLDFLQDFLQELFAGAVCKTRDQLENGCRSVYCMPNAKSNHKAPERANSAPYFFKGSRSARNVE